MTKVLHSCSEDLEVFHVAFGVLPQPVFDTQVAAAFCGFGFSTGYANLIKAMLGLELPKDATRSDWLQRPLAQVQKNYAALDVAHLLVVYGKLLASLRDSERLPWVLEDCHTLVEQGSAARAINHDYYQKLKLAWKLDREGLQILRAVCDWREQHARDLNVPRNRLLKDQSLADVARFKPPHVAKLSTIDGIHGRFLREFGDSFMAAIKTALAQPQDQWPAKIPKPLPPAMGDLTKALKACVQQIADQLDIPAEMLARKADYNHICRSVLGRGKPSLSTKILTSWRNDLIGQALLECAENYSHGGT